MTVRRLFPILIIIVLAAQSALLATLAIVEPSGGQIEGLLIGPDGRALASHSVVLIDGDGNEIASAVGDRRGRYKFKNVAPGRYSLAIGNTAGKFAPVAAPPLKITDGQLVQRYLKLVETEALERDRVERANPSAGSWFASQINRDTAMKGLGLLFRDRVQLTDPLGGKSGDDDDDDDDDMGDDDDDDGSSPFTPTKRGYRTR